SKGTILIECTPHVAMLRLRTQSKRVEGKCHWPGEHGEPIEATKRRSHIGGKIDQLHVVQANVLCPLQPFSSRCEIRDSRAREPTVQQRLPDRSMRSLRAHVLDHPYPPARPQQA